jgi:hypothetical protein
MDGHLLPRSLSRKLSRLLLARLEVKMLVCVSYKAPPTQQAAGLLNSLKLQVPPLVINQLEAGNFWFPKPKSKHLLPAKTSSYKQVCRLPKLLHHSDLDLEARGSVARTNGNQQPQPLTLGTASDSSPQRLVQPQEMQDLWLVPQHRYLLISTPQELTLTQSSLPTQLPNPPQWPPSQPWASWALSPSQSVLSPCSSEQCPLRGH